MMSIDHARLRELDPNTELIDHASMSDGFLLDGPDTGVAGASTALRFVVEAGEQQVHRAADIADACLSDLAAGESRRIIAGALPFRNDTAGVLTVHQRTVQRTSAGVWMSELGDVDDAPSGSCSVGHVVDATPVPTEAEYAAAVADALDRIDDGQITKVVLARTLEVVADGVFDVRAVVRRLLQDPSCYTFAAPTPSGMFVGASPESLVRRRGNTVASRPHAGSRPRSADPVKDKAGAEDLIASAKDLREHAFVVESVADTLAPFCTRLDVASAPHLVSTASIWHLATDVRGVLRDDAPSALGLAAALHPTPAVCGTPTDAAYEAIAQLEPAGRGPYAGLVGWVDANGDGDWIVALRCAVLDGARARLFAGAGIVAGSDPWLEVAETQAKFAAMLDALRDC